MVRKRRVKRRGVRRRRIGGKRQKGGIFPLLGLAIPALAAAGKAAALGAVGSAAGYGIKKEIDAATRKRRR